MRRLLVIGLAAAGLCSAAIDGTVMNGTTGQVAGNVQVTLLKPGQQGMRILGTTNSDAQGHFAFANDEPGGGPQLLQALFDGVTYNKLLTPNIPTSGVDLEVYAVTKSPALAHISQRMILLEPNLSQIGVNETVIIQNQSKQTYDNPAVGGVQFYLPPAANGQVRVQAQGPQGMPLPKAAEKTGKSNVFKVEFPVKPGETEFQITYTIPAGSPFTFRGEVAGVKGMPTGPLRLIAPPGVTFSGNDVQQLGTEPNTQAVIYNVKPTDGPYSFDIAGTGALRGDQGNQAVDTSDQPQVTQGNPPIYAHLLWLVGLALGVLAVGLLVLFRTSPVESPRS